MQGKPENKNNASKDPIFYQCEPNTLQCTSALQWNENLKDPSQPPTIFDDIEIIDIAW